MRDRTPSADDTPKRAPPAPSREAASADVAGGSKTINGTVEVFRGAKLECTKSGAASAGDNDNRMVASTDNLDEIAVNHLASVSNDRQQQQVQEKPGHPHRPGQTTQDKRSRLSNVINNLRKKVPDTRTGDSPKKEEDDRNSVERNLETLEKYVMTVLNGVIKDEEEDEREIGRKMDVESMEKNKDLEKITEEQEDEDSKGPAAKFEPSKPNESRTESAVLPVEHGERTMDRVLGCDLEKKGPSKESDKDTRSQQCLETQVIDEDQGSRMEDTESCKLKVLQNMENVAFKRASSSESKSETHASQEVPRPESQDLQEDKKECRSLGTIILERLSEHQSLEDRAVNLEKSKEELWNFVPESVELRNICRDLLNDLLSDINQLIDENTQETDDKRTPECSMDDFRDSKANQEPSMTSLHCSLPLDKVASVLQNCQSEASSSASPTPSASPSCPSSSSSLSPSSTSASPQSVTKSPSKPLSPTVRHLCLYCDRKFSSISLRQRHTERVHQLGGGRRSERNSRKPSQNCQYCSDKCAESLEGLFQHMVGNHGDKYHACVQCSTRYLTREALAGHISETHGGSVDRAAQIMDKVKECPREKSESQIPKERRPPEEAEPEQRPDSNLLKPPMSSAKDTVSNPGSPEFDSSFYSSVSCNIRENLLHHLDGKLQSTSSSSSITMASAAESKQLQPTQTFFEHNANQIQFPIDISLTAATPVYSKDYASEEYENSSEYAQKPGKSSKSHPRRVSFEKYNFPRKYDGKEQWTCSIKDLSKFDISTQLSLRKKQQLIKERLTLSRLHQIPISASLTSTDVVQTTIECEEHVGTKESTENLEETTPRSNAENVILDQSVCRDSLKSAASDSKPQVQVSSTLKSPEFSDEFVSFLRLRKWNENGSESGKTQEVVYAELTGEWSRPRIYICGACASRHVTLKEMEEHKASSHPHVWCSHFEFSGDQRELYKHLFLPGRSVATANAKSAVLSEKVCTKCTKNCNTLSELHRHMLECAGDQAWLSGLFGNGKKKCKWRPFGSRSRRRRQRGMKRNIQNSQTPRVNVPREKQPTGPRVRPSDRESIQKMLANLPPKRATRKVLQDSTMRSQGRLRNVQTRSRPRMVGDNSSASRMSRNKAALRNKLLKNAKSIQRNRCRSDNISAIIESVVKNCSESAKTMENRHDAKDSVDSEKTAKEKSDQGSKDKNSNAEERSRKVTKSPRVLAKKRNIRTKDGAVKSLDQIKRREKMGLKKKTLKGEVSTDPTKLKNAKMASKEADPSKSNTSPESKFGSPGKNKSPTQTTPKRKRPVDPVASLNASIKAKSQLRAHDGKFARNPKKDTSAGQKTPVKNQGSKFNAKTPGEGSSEDSPESWVTRSKLRTVSRNRNNDVQKRTTRLSSDSDKMPTLEPAVQVPSNEEDPETSANDLPILSPVVTLASGAEQKNLRGKSSKNVDGEKDASSSPRKNEANVDRSDHQISAHSSQEAEEEKIPRPGKGRRPKNEGKLNFKMKDSENVLETVDASLKEVTKGSTKDVKVRGRKSAPAKLGDYSEDDRKEEVKKVGGLRGGSTDFSPRKQKKDDAASKSFETRSNSRARLDRPSDAVSEPIKVPNISFKMKKLIGSDNKEDLLTKLGLTSREASSKRSLRQSAPRSKLLQVKNKSKDLDAEKLTALESPLAADTKVLGKKEKPDSRRKSPRNVEKKSSVDKDRRSLKDNVEEGNRSGIRGRRSMSLSNETKSNPINSNRVSSLERARVEKDNQNKAEAAITSENADEENVNNKRQTRGSILNMNDLDTQDKEIPKEASDTAFKKNTSLGKRRGRIKSSNELHEKNIIELIDKTSDVCDKKHPPELDLAISKFEDTERVSLPAMTDKDRSLKTDDTNEDTKKAMADSESVSRINSDEMVNVMIDSKLEKFEANMNTETRIDAELVNLSLSNVHLESSNSIDSGKENSLEATITTQKFKVGRPKKSWGSRRERSSKRTLSNVIGILTEGMNIPVEVQQSVVLTVQTSLDNPEGVVQSNAQQPIGSNVPSGRSSSSERSERSSDNDTFGANSSDQTNEGSRSCAQEKEQERTSQTSDDAAKNLGVNEAIPRNQKVGTSSSNNAQSPTNDIILDLSRRKPKGKGSFLEKIVSKIAKQKDALLEGEVGSLLDTAADELTSILDEVGPAFTETGENTKIQGSNQQSMDNKSEASGSSVQGSSNGRQAKVDRRDDVRIVEFLGAPCNSNKEESMKTADNSSLDKKPDIPIHVPRDETEITESMNLPSNAPNIPNGIRVPIIPNIQEPASMFPQMSSSSKADCGETSLKSSDNLCDEVKPIKWRSKKRSLEDNSPKKSKRQSVDVTETAEESLVPEEFQLSDIMKLIRKSEQVPSIKDNSGAAQNNNPDANYERVQPGKRKPTNDQFELKEGDVHSLEANVEESTLETMDGIKKLKVDVDADANQSKFCKPDDKSNIEGQSGTSNENATKVAESGAPSLTALKIAGKRKSFPEVTDQFPEAETPGRRHSKRRSLPEDRLGHTPSKELQRSQPFPDDFGEVTDEGTTSESSRRRSSRSKLPILELSESDEKQQKNDELHESMIVEKAVSIENVGNPPLQNVPLIKTTILRVPELSKIFDRGNRELEMRKSMENHSSGLSESSKILNEIIIPKVPKKRGRKKKSLVNEHLSLNDTAKNVLSQGPAESTVSSGSLSAKESAKSNENLETGDQSKTNSETSTAMAHFKIPEVSEVLQHTKKRTLKRRSLVDEHLELACSESEASNTEMSDVSKSSVSEKDQEEQQESINKRDAMLDDANRSFGESIDSQVEKLGRPNSSSSIDLIPSSRTRFSRRKQLSSDDLSRPEALNRRAESADNLSETSCASESSYFRKKRFSKKKKDFQKPPDDVQTDASITDSESVDTEKSERRQILKRKAKNNISFVDDNFDLVDDFDIPMDIQESLNIAVARNAEEVHHKSSDKQKITNENRQQDASNEVADEKESVALLEDQKSGALKPPGEQDSENYRTEEGFQTPKKRSAGNFVVVHTKTGEILIVEKRKKLTKEAAKFFCDVCATSFTRKSSLKKHNSSQSHLLQVIKSSKEKGCMETNDSSAAETSKDSNWKSESLMQDESLNDDDKSLSKLSDDDESNDFNENPEYSASLQSTGSLIDPRVDRPESFEDELLDEEICKITENMSHDEYVLTDHVSPAPPESSSTPIQKNPEVAVKKKKNEKKREKGKRKNLADEHLALDSPEPKKRIDASIISSSTEGSNSSPKETVQGNADKPFSEPSIADKNLLNDSPQIETAELPPNTSKSIVAVDQLQETNFEMQVDNSGLLMEEEGVPKAESEKSVDKELQEFMETKYPGNQISSKLADYDKETEVSSGNGSSGKPILNEDQTAHEHFGFGLAINQFNQESNTVVFNQESSNLEIPECSQQIGENSDDVYEYNEESSIKSEHKMEMESAGKSHNVKPEDSISNVNVDLITFTMHDEKDGNKDVEKESSESIQSELTQTHCFQPDFNLMLDHSQSEMSAVSVSKVASESASIQHHSKSKKNKAKKHIQQEEQEHLNDSLSSDRRMRKASKSKQTQSKHVLEEAAGSREENNENMENSLNKDMEMETIGVDEATDRSEQSKSVLETRDLVDLEGSRSEDGRSEELKVPDEGMLKVADDFGILEEYTPEEDSKDEDQAKDELEEDKDDVQDHRERNHERENEPHVEDDEASSSSSFADKHPPEVLEILEDKDEAGDEVQVEISSDASKTIDEPGNEWRLEILKNSSKTDLEADETYLETQESPEIPRCASNSGLELDEDKPGMVSADAEESNRDGTANENAVKSQVSWESENSEDESAIVDLPYDSSFAKDVAEGVEEVIQDKKPSKGDRKVTGNARRSGTSDRQNKMAGKSHKSTSKDGHRRSRGAKGKVKKPSARSKYTDITSDSDDTENEDTIESQIKSKIVKSVFGRVFGGEKVEKVDKVKEVLNDWVSKSEDESDASRGDLGSSNEANSSYRSKESTDERDRSKKRHSTSSSASSGAKKRPGRKPKKSSLSIARIKDKNATFDGKEEQATAGKQGKSRNSSKNRRKQEPDAINNHFVATSVPSELDLPTSRCRQSKKRAEERISRAFDESPVPPENPNISKKLLKQKESYELRNQKSDLSLKDSGYGSFNYDEEPMKSTAHLEDHVPPLNQEEESAAKRRKTSVSRKTRKKPDDEDWKDFMNIEEEETPAATEMLNDESDSSTMKNQSQKEVGPKDLDLESSSSRSCSSLARSSVRNRSPSLDGHFQIAEDEDDEEGQDKSRRMSPVYVCGSPESSLGSGSHTENEEEEEEEMLNEEAQIKRCSSEFSGEKIVIRSPSSTHKTEVVTIAPTDAIEDNALDVPQDIETAKPRQGKVLNFDEELFVECCSRLKATTETELRGAKKIKLDHVEAYHRKDDRQQGFRVTKDRWRDVESQNSLGSLLESVNQLLGEEMYSNKERDYPKRSTRNIRSEHSSRSTSPDMSRADNLGYEDSLDVAFEHNNKLRDKIQQRMRESENLIATTFGQKITNEIPVHHQKSDEHDSLRNYVHLHEQEQLSGFNVSNGGYNDGVHIRSPLEQQNKMHLDSSGFKSKINSALGGLLDKALSNLLHSNGKHDHNGSTPMKVLAELACARAPTSTSREDPCSQEIAKAPKASSISKDSIQLPNPASIPKELQMKKPRNPIKELFERKKEINDRKQQEKSKAEAALRELNAHRQRKTKKTKKRQEFPLIRRSEHGGLAEKKKRRDGVANKDVLLSDRIKDVYEFDEEESQIESNLGTVMSYRNKMDKNYEVSCVRTKEVDVATLMSKAIGDSLENGKTGVVLGTRLESMIDRKFKELEKFAPKTKGALKAFQSEDQQQQRQITGPMDEFIERKQRSKGTVEGSLKYSKLKKRSKNPKKKTKSAWYENDSSDEYRTAVKAKEDIGVGISKSQRACSKGKQNLFAELSTSSESEFDEEDVDHEAKKQRRVKRSAKQMNPLDDNERNVETTDKYQLENDVRIDDWDDQDLTNDASKHDSDHKKSESEMSDQPLVIDERKEDDQRNSDEETENQYERSYVLDDLYREDSSVADTDLEEQTNIEKQLPDAPRSKSPLSSQDKDDAEKPNYPEEEELIPLEEALDMLDQPDSTLGAKYEQISQDTNNMELNSNSATINESSMNGAIDEIQLADEKDPGPVDDQDELEEEPDDDLLTLPEKLSSNEKPQKESENLPLHVFLSRKVQESKKRKEEQLKKLQEEQERILMEFPPTRRQRKCAIGKQGLLAEISSSDEETCSKDTRKIADKSDERPRKQKRESKEKRKERYIEKKHEQMIAKEQKAIEEEILRELGKKKDNLSTDSLESKLITTAPRIQESSELTENKNCPRQMQRKRHQAKEKQRKTNKEEEEEEDDDEQEQEEEEEEEHSKNEALSDFENNCNKSTHSFTDENNPSSPIKQKKHSKSPIKKSMKTDSKSASGGRRSKTVNAEKSKSAANGKDSKERRSSSGRRDSGDEELKTTKSWNKVEEGIGVAIGRRKRAAANQLYYWSSSSDEEEMMEVVPTVEEEEDDHQEQHGWIVGDSHKRMITMLAMEKQLKEKRRRSEDEFQPGRTKSKKHRNSTS